MSKSRKSLTPTGTVSRHSRSNSFPDNALADSLKPPRKTSRERRSFDAVPARSGPDPLQDGKLLVLKVIGKVNLRIERKEYQDLIRIVNQIPGDVLFLILDNLSIESLYADIPSSLASLEALYSKIFYDRQGRLPDHGLSSDDFVHHLVRYFVDVLKYNNQTFASARSREHIKNVFNICTQMDDSLHQRLVQRAEQFSKALSGFSEHALLETITRSSATYYMKMHEALRTELERAVSHYKHALQKLSDALLNVPHNSEELSSAIAGQSQADMDEKTAQYMRKMSGQSIEDRLFFNQSLFNAVQINSRDKLLVTDLVDKLVARINHDKEVLQLLSQLRKEFNISRDEHVLPLLERFHHGHRLVLQLLEESQKGVVKTEAKLKIPTITHTIASDPESGDVSTNEEGDGGSDTDVFDTVTQLDDETEFSALSSVTVSSSSENEHTQNVESAQGKNPSPDDSTQKPRDEKSSLRKQLEEKQKELEAAQKTVQNLTKREKDLIDRLQDQAQRQLKKGGKFEDLSAGDCRPSVLVERYDNLYTQTRLDAMDELDELESLDKLDDNGDIKKKILFSVVVVAFRTVQQALTEKQHKLKQLLDIPDEETKAAQTQDIQDRLNDYFRQTGARLKIDKIKRDVSKQLWSTLYDFPELQNCIKLKEYMDECVRLSWMMAVQIPPMIIEYEATEFSDKLHGRFMTSDMKSLAIKYHVWPALIDSQGGHVLYRGVVVT